jgi:ribosomal protein S18 acetylase RimI-like enzyme
VTASSYRLESLNSNRERDLASFDCGDENYNNWLSKSALSATKAGTSAVYLLIESRLESERIAGYFAICPTMVVRDSMPSLFHRGSISETPGWLITKLAVSSHLRGTQVGAQLLREALVKIAVSSDVGGGRVIVVDAGNPKLVGWYLKHGFKSAGVDSNRLFMKVKTARRYLVD